MRKLGQHLINVARAQRHYFRLRGLFPFDLDTDVCRTPARTIQSLAEARLSLPAERILPSNLRSSNTVPEQWADLAVLQRDNVIGHPSGSLTDRSSRFFIEDFTAWETKPLHRITAKKALSTVVPTIQSIDRAFWVGGLHGHNYYHWILEKIPRLALAREFIKEAKLPVVLRADSPFQVQSLEQLFPELEFISAPSTHAVRIKECYYVTPAEPGGVHDPRLVHALRRAAGSPTLPRSNGLRIWIDRPSHNRPLVPYSDRLDSCLLDLKFTRVKTENLTFSEQLDLFKQAQLVAGGHGAGLTNFVFTAPQTPLIEVSSSFYAYGCFARAAAALHRPYQVVLTDQLFRFFGSTDHGGAAPIQLSRRDEQRLIQALQLATK